MLPTRNAKTEIELKKKKFKISSPGTHISLGWETLKKSVVCGCSLMKVALGSDVLLTSTISFSKTPRCAIN